MECVAFGGEGDSVVVSGSFDGTVRFWDTKGGGGRPIMVLNEAGDSVSCLEVRGEVVVTGCVDGRVRWYDLRMGMVATDVVGGEFLRVVFFDFRFSALLLTNTDTPTSPKQNQ